MNIGDGFGCNDNELGNQLTAKVYVQGGATLIELKFEEKVEYKS